VSGWDDLNAAIATARELISAAAADPEVAAEGEAYIARVVAAGLGGAVLGHLFQQDGLSRALPCYGGPNPDYIMRFAPVDASRSYRLEGRLNGSERVGVGLYNYEGPNGVPLEVGYTAFDSSNTAPDGSFAIDLGPDGLPVPPGARVVLIRVLHRDPESDPARLSFTGGAPASGLALATGSADGALGFAAHSLANNVREYLKWTKVARQYRNRLDSAPPELTATVQGDRDTQYFLGGYDLGEGEWLQVTMPAGMGGYWSLHAYNYWYEHLQTPGAHDRNTRPDADGRIRIAVGPVLPPDAANRIDTLGRRMGAFVCRIIGGSDGRPGTELRRLD
jgi:hypothetical protein